MTKKFKKRSLSESNVTEKSENKDTNDASVSSKKPKVEAVPNAQSNVVSKKMKKGPQGEANANKKKQEKNKNENNVKKVTPTATGKEKEENQSNQNPVSQEGGLNRKERNKLKKAENNKLSKEKRKLFRREEGNAKTKTGQLSQEQIQERIKELESRENLSKTAKKKLAVFRKLLQVQDGANNTQKNTKTEETDNTNPPETTNSAIVAKKQNKKRGSGEVSEDNKTEKKIKLGKTAGKAVNENDTKSPPTQSANKQKSKKQKNANAQPGSLLRVKSKKNEDEDDDESSEDEETESEVKATKEINKEDVEEEEEEDEDDEDGEEEEEDEDDDDDEDEDENEVEGEEEEEDEDVEDEEENEDDEEENEDEGTDIKLKKKGEEENEDEGTDIKLKKKGEEKTKGSNDATKKKGNEITNNKNQELKKKRYVVFVSNVPYSASSDQIREHFLTKVSKISDVRIPKKPGTNQPRGFCYVELENQEDYEKALTLNHSFLDKRRIIVQYSPGSKHTNAKQIIVAKNKKFDALRKEGKLAGSKRKTDKNVKKGKQNAVSTTA